MTDTRQIPQPMRPTAESRMAQDGQTNAGGQRRVDDGGNPYYDSAPLSEYPRMMFRATEVPVTQEWADSISELKDAPMVINRYDGLLCETRVASDVSEAESLTEDGWDISPKAAHGIVDGLAKAASAKDEEIAMLRAQLEVANAGNPANIGDTVKRGPGRPKLSMPE